MTRWWWWRISLRRCQSADLPLTSQLCRRTVAAGGSVRCIFALLAVIVLLAQCLGLQLVCLCGNCSLSRAWLGQTELAATEQPCCRASRLRAAHDAAGAARPPSQISDDDCACSEHVLAAVDGETQQGWKTQAGWALSSSDGVVDVDYLTRMAAHTGTAWAPPPQVARGPPPGPPSPFWLLHQTLLI